MVTGRTGRAALAALLVLATSARTDADEGGCAGGTVAPGDAPARVLALCGEPADRVVETRVVRVLNHIGIEVEREREVETWLYEASSGRPARTFEFIEGELSAIREGRGRR